MKRLNAILVGYLLIACFGCNPMGREKFKLEFKNPGYFKDLKVEIANVSVVNDQLVISGSTLGAVRTVTLKNDSQEEQFLVESASENQIIANGAKAVSIIAGSVFDLILADAYGQATYQVTFSVSDGAITAEKIANGAVTAAKLDSMGASAGQYLKYNGSTWVASSLIDGQNYLGTWNAGANTPDLTNPSTYAGDYYVVSDGGTFSGVAYGVGDWIISDGYNWQKLPYSKTSVSSFQGRKGIVTLVPGDYVSLKDTGTGKITGSNLNDLANIDLTTVAPIAGNILKYDGTKWVAGADNAGIAAGSIVDADISATADIAQSKISGLATSLSAKQETSSLAADVRAIPLTGLSSTTGAVVAADTILSAFGKLLNSQSDYVSKSSGADIVAGTIAVSGTGMITIPTATGTTSTEATNVEYVTNAIAANGVWVKSGTTINYTAGNVGIGTATPTYSLHVVPNGGTANQTLFVQDQTAVTGSTQVVIKSGAGQITASTRPFVIQNSAGTSIFSIDPWGLASIATTMSSSSVMTSNITGSNSWSATAVGDRLTISDGVTVLTPAAGTVQMANFSQKFSPTSGTAINNIIAVTPTINQTGGANGVTRGIYVNPTLTAAADFRALETVAGNVLLGSTSGKVGIGTTNPNAKLYIQTPNATNINEGITIGRGAANNELGLRLKSDAGGLYRGAITYRDASSGVENEIITLGANSNNSNVGIGTTAPGSLLSLGASIAAKKLLVYEGAGNNFGGFGIPGDSTFRMFGWGTAGTSLTFGGLSNDGNNTFTERMRLSASGNLGLGTNNPLARLVVDGSHTGAGLVRINTVGGNIGDVTGLDFQHGGNTQAYIRTYLNTGWPTDLIFGTATGQGAGLAERMRITSSGNIGIGMVPASEKLEVNGNVKAAAFLYSSDQRLKQNIEPIEDALGKINLLNGYSYEWKSTSRPELGVIAQEVEQVFPALVATDSKGMKSVKYGNLIAPIIEAIKEFFSLFMSDSKEKDRRLASIEATVAKKNAEIAELKNKSAALESQNEKLRKKMQQIELSICEINPSASICRGK